MREMKRIVQVCYFLLLAGGWSLAQNNEVSFSVGPAFTTDQKLQVDSRLPGCQIQGCTALFTFAGSTSVAFGVGYARRLADMGPVALYVELPVVEQPSHALNVSTNNQTNNLAFRLFGPGHTSAFFFTPSARIQFVPKQRISPWITGGYGFTHLSQDFSSSKHTKGAAQFGGGIDVRTLPHLVLRGEVRDFWTAGMLESNPVATLTQQTALTSHMQHIYAGGGVVLKF
ncbi:hypothetical protein AYO50_01195 [Acidobacteria bacterium SCGC AG-212-P17]|nr:hypothetical protein AYO50_01195 [Acidobacteria bacterium SCGC AG-212-P17]